MNSSDSEEDFESADEDLDLNNPLKSQNKKEDIKIYACNEKDTNENTSSDAISTEITEEVEQVSFNKESLDSDNKNILKIEASQDEAIKSMEVDSPNTEETKIKPSVKKLATKLRNECIVQQKEGDTQSNLDKQKGKNIKESRIKPMKLGMKLNPEDLKHKVNVDNIPNKELFDKHKDVKTENYLDNYESTFIYKDDVAVAVKPSQTIPKPEEINFEAGDGWELEEEDGFEIPVTLAKNGDAGIQCPQEQICHLDQVEFRLPKAEQEQGWGGWGGWGVGSLLSTATDTVTTFSSQVSAGLSTVLETTVGAPDPETLVNEQASHREFKEEPSRTEDEMGPGYGGLGSIMSGVSFLGSSVINRGLDTLETIGKKTMEVLQEGDPGLKKKRAMLFHNEEKPILSQILREAKERADNSDKEKEEKEAARKVHFESLFDDFQGMVHLEALEMLSTQCELKLQSLLQSHSGTQLLDLQETLSQIRDLCEVPEEEEDAEVLTEEQFAEKVTYCVEGLRIQITPTRIIKVNGDICERLEQQLCGTQSATVVNQTAISSLAELTAAAMECFHKSAELVMAKPTHNTADEADSYVQLTSHLCARVSAVANEFTQLLTKNNPIANSSLITNIFLEASNSCSYIKNACQLLVPILQVGAVAS